MRLFEQPVARPRVNAFFTQLLDIDILFDIMNFSTVLVPTAGEDTEEERQ